MNNDRLKFRHKCKCGSELFIIKEYGDCSVCQHNGIQNEETGMYEYPNQEGGMRTEVSDNGECQIGMAFGEGCYFFICSKCTKDFLHIPMRYD